MSRDERVQVDEKQFQAEKESRLQNHRALCGNML
jgi:hypothetical protein